MVTQETKNDTLAAGAEVSKEVSATRVELDDLLQEAKKKGKEFTRAQKKEIRKFLESNPEFALTKEQRLVLIDELTGIEPEKLDKIKQYLYQRDLIRHLAGKAAGLHKQDVEATIKARLETISATPDNLKNILTEIREKKVEGNNKYMLLYTAYTRFFAAGKFGFDEKGKIIVKKPGTENKDAQDQQLADEWNKIVTVDEWKQTRLYMKLITAPVGEDLENMANKIALKYRFDLGSDLEALRARIRADESMNEDDRFIIECYISEKKDGKKILPQEVSEGVKQTQQNNVKARENFNATFKTQMTAEDWKNGMRDPIGFITNLFGKMGPLGIISTVGLVIGWMMGKDIFGEKSSVLMKILAVGSGLSLAKATGAADYVADLIEDKNEARDGWAWATQKVTGGTAETWKRLVLWYKYSHFQVKNNMDKDEKIVPGSVDLIDANFVHLYRSAKRNNLALGRDDSKEIKKDEISDIHSKINSLYTEGMALKHADGTPRFADEVAFEKEIAGMSLAQVIDFVTNPAEKKPAKEGKSTDNNSQKETSRETAEKKEEKAAPADQESGPKKKQGIPVNLDF